MSYKKIIISGLLACVFVFSFVYIQQALAVESYGLDTAANQAGLRNKVAGQSDVTLLIGNIVSIALSFVAVGFFLLVLYAGFKWMFAAGNNEDITKAKGILEAAAIGLIIVLSAYAISSFVFRTIGAGGGSNGVLTCTEKHGGDAFCDNECAAGTEDREEGLCEVAGEICCTGE